MLIKPNRNISHQPKQYCGDHYISLVTLLPLSSCWKTNHRPYIQCIPITFWWKDPWWRERRNWNHAYTLMISMVTIGFLEKGCKKEIAFILSQIYRQVTSLTLKSTLHTKIIMVIPELMSISLSFAIALPLSHTPHLSPFLMEPAANWSFLWGLSSNGHNQFYAILELYQCWHITDNTHVEKKE